MDKGKNMFNENMFYDYIMDRVENENKDAAKKLLKDSFSTQDKRAFTRDYLMKTHAELSNLIKSESNDEVKAAMIHYASLAE